MGLFYNFTTPMGGFTDFLPPSYLNHGSYGKWKKGSVLSSDATIVNVNPIGGKITSGYEYNHQQFGVLFSDGFMYVTYKKVDYRNGFYTVRREWTQDTIAEVKRDAIAEHKKALDIQKENFGQRSAEVEKVKQSSNQSNQLNGEQFKESNASNAKKNPQPVYRQGETIRFVDIRNRNTEALKKMDVETLFKDAKTYIQNDLGLAYTGVAVLRDAKTDRLYASFDITPSGMDSIKAMIVSVKCFSVWGDSLPGVDDYQVLDLSTSQYETYCNSALIPLPDPTTRTVRIDIKKIAMSSGKIINRSNVPEVTDDSPDQYFQVLEFLNNTIAEADNIYSNIMNSKVGQEVSFGSVLLDENEPRTPLKWIIIKEESDRSLLLSSVSLGDIALSYSKVGYGWKNCKLREWLNTEMYEVGFSPLEKDFILENDEVFNDKIFLLSDRESEIFLNNINIRCCKDQYSQKCSWWLRSKGKNYDSLMLINKEGRLDSSGASGPFKAGIRPAIWIKTEKKELNDLTKSPEVLKTNTPHHVRPLKIDGYDEMIMCPVCGRKQVKGKALCTGCQIPFKYD